MLKQAPDHRFWFTFVATEVFLRSHWRDIGFEGYLDDFTVFGTLWEPADPDDTRGWVDALDDDDRPAIEFEIGADELHNALVWLAGLANDDLRRRAAGVENRTVTEASYWVADGVEPASPAFRPNDVDAVLQIAVQLASGEKRPLVMFSQV